MGDFDDEENISLSPARKSAPKQVRCLFYNNVQLIILVTVTHAFFNDENLYKSWLNQPVHYQTLKLDAS